MPNPNKVVKYFDKKLANVMPRVWIALHKNKAEIEFEDKSRPVSTDENGPDGQYVSKAYAMMHNGTTVLAHYNSQPNSYMGFPLFNGYNVAIDGQNRKSIGKWRSEIIFELMERLRDAQVSDRRRKWESELIANARLDYKGSIVEPEYAFTEIIKENAILAENPYLLAQAQIWHNRLHSIDTTVEVCLEKYRSNCGKSESCPCNEFLDILDDRSKGRTLGDLIEWGREQQNSRKK